MKRSLSILCAFAFIGAVMTTGCEKKKAAEPAKTEPAATTEPKKEEPKKEEPKKEEPKKDEAKATDGVEKIGVKECDDYLAKYMACVDSKVPEAARANMKKTFAMVTAAWKKSATTDAGKAALAKGCTQAHEAAKKAMAAYKCEW